MGGGGGRGRREYLKVMTGGEIQVVEGVGGKRDLRGGGEREGREEGGGGEIDNERASVWILYT